MTEPVYFAVPAPDGQTMTYWHQTGQGLKPWPAKARYGPRLLKTAVPAHLAGADRTAWLVAWADANVLPFNQAIHAAIAADPDGCAARFAAIEVRCVSCGRVLREPRSKIAGIGPECEKDFAPGDLAAIAAEVAAQHAALACKPTGGER